MTSASLIAPHRPKDGYRISSTLRSLRIAMLSIHSSPLGELGTGDTGGMSVYIREISRELGKAGHRVDIYTCAGSGRIEELLSENVRLIPLCIENNGHFGKSALLGYLPEVFLSIEAHMTANGICYDLVHSHYWLSGSVGRLAQDRWCVPHILMFHTTGIAKRMACGQEREPFIRLISEKRLARASDRVLAATESEKRLLMKYYDVSGEKIGVVPCGVNLQLFRPVARRLARQELGLHDSEFIALYVGRFAAVKGLERLLAAAAHLRFQRGVRFVIIGGDDQNTPVSTELRSLTKRASIGGIVQFQGRIEHNLLPLYYSAADVLVVPSYYESFGLVALESLACGTPVIATRVGAMDTLIQNGRTGFLVDSPSPILLASAIESIMIARSKRRISRDQIRASVLGYGWSDVASAIAQEYATVFQAVAHKRVIIRK